MTMKFVFILIAIVGCLLDSGNTAPSKLPTSTAETKVVDSILPVEYAANVDYYDSYNSEPAYYANQDCNINGAVRV